jgi:hypothetical protein
MLDTGLTLCSTSQATAEQWGRRQPDWVLVSHHHKRIAIVDLCRPSDVHPAQLLAAAVRKQQTYLPLQEALSYYSDQGWTIHVFPWVVGIRGMIDPSHIQSLLKFLEIQRRHWQTAVERTVLASVRGLHFLHKVRFGGLPEAARPELDPDHSEADSDDAVGGVRIKRNPHRSTTGAPQDCTDSDSPEAGGPGDELWVPKKACRLSVTRGTNAAVVGAAASPSAPDAVRGLTLSLHPRVSGAVSGSRLPWTARRESLKVRTAKARIKARAKPPAAPARCAGPSWSGGLQRPKRKCEERTTTSNAPDLNGAGQRPAKRPQRATPEAPPEVLWNRWRQMEPRQHRRT